MTRNLYLFFVVLLALVEIVLCTGRERQRILDEDGASESEQHKINQGKEALKSIDYRVPKYKDIFPKTSNSSLGKAKGLKKEKNPNPPNSSSDQFASGGKKAKKQKSFNASEGKKAKKQKSFNPPKVTGPSSKSLKFKSKVEKRSKKQSGIKTKSPAVPPHSDSSSRPTILPVYASTKSPAVATSAPSEPLQTTQAPSPPPPTQAPTTPIPSTATPVTPVPPLQCSTPEEKCCGSDDCASGSSCENRNCVQDGFLRFTLTWFGDGDIDLRVRTPDGTLIFYENPFDPVSGGTLEEDVDPEGDCFHAENIFFPEDSAPLGTYQFGVSGEGQLWELYVYLDGELVDLKAGRGLSPDFGFEYGFCQKEQEECCIAQDCAEQEELGDVCTNRNCITDGFIRFTLSWEGTNDKDLQVTTPNGGIINFEFPLDELTGGTLERDVQPAEFGRYVENIYFPYRGEPLPGTYLYDVTAGGLEIWTVQIYLDGELINTLSGIQDASMLTFELPDTKE